MYSCEVEGLTTPPTEIDKQALVISCIFNDWDTNVDCVGQRQMTVYETVVYCLSELNDERRRDETEADNIIESKGKKAEESNGGRESKRGKVKTGSERVYFF